MKKFITYFLGNTKGQSLIELLMVIGLAAIILPALLVGFFATRGGRAQEDQRQKAVQLVREGEEAARVIREGDWESMVTGTYYPYVPSGTTTWALHSGTETLTNGFTRTIVISDVYRNSNGIIDTTGTLDPSTKKVTTTVCWDNGACLAPNFVTATEYLSRYISNTSFTDTSVDDFNKGSFFSAQAVCPSCSSSDANGQVTLQYSPGGSDWCSPGDPVLTHDLGGNGLAGSVVAGINRAFVGTGQNASSHPFYNVVLSYSGGVPSIPSSPEDYDDNGLKANDVFGDTVGSRSYAYLGTNVNGGRQAVILDVTDNTPVFLNSIPKQSSNTNTNSIYVSDNVLFLTAGSNLYAYNVTDRKNPSYISSFSLQSIGKKIFVVNGYVYIALGSTTNQFQIVDATDPSHMKNPGGAGAIVRSVGNSEPGVSLYVLSDGSRAYLITARSSTQSDFFIINTSDKTNPSVIGTGYSTGTMDPKGVTVIDNRAIIVGFTNPRYQVLRVNNDVYDSCIAKDEPDDIYNVSSQYVNGYAFSYITTANVNSAFEMIRGGAGGSGGYAANGSYDSGISWTALTLPSTNPTAFNHFDVTYVKPGNTNITFQVAVGDAVGGSCSAFSYAGPGEPPATGTFTTEVGNGSNPVTQSFAIPFGSNGSGYANPGKCFAYKVFLYGDPSDTSITPALNDITVNYSP